ncbi:MAG: hypothetical protein U9O94_10115 [Nanoarchaeota archaeon]|nr:hypothetical protein [Nanoarchaeota archaeon]
MNMLKKQGFFKNFPLGKRAITILSLLIVCSSFAYAESIEIMHQYDDKPTFMQTRSDNPDTNYWNIATMAIGQCSSHYIFVMNFNRTCNNITVGSTIDSVILSLKSIETYSDTHDSFEAYNFTTPNPAYDLITYNTLGTIDYSENLVTVSPSIPNGWVGWSNTTLSSNWFQGVCNQVWEGQATNGIHFNETDPGCVGVTTSYYATDASDPIIYVNSTPPESTTAPTLSDINCTSCGIPGGDDNPPYETYDTTPTFTLSTDITAYCRIDNENLNYSAMGPSRNCTRLGGGFNHACTLNVDDELKLTPTDYTYIVCGNSGGGDETSQSLEMKITQIQPNASQAMEKGIVISIPSATIYSDQQVYVRTISNQQELATFDKVALYGTQRWAFNYIDDSVNESSIGTFYNLTPVFYFLELINLSTQAIIEQVSEFINTTKT